MYVIVETGGKQYKMAEGDILDVELLPVKVGENFVLDKVLFFSDEEKGYKVGQPYLEGYKVEVKVLERFKDKKVIVFKFKNKTGYKRLKGHRQNYNRIKVEKIEGVGIKREKSSAKTERISKDKNNKETKIDKE